MSGRSSMKGRRLSNRRQDDCGMDVVCAGDLQDAEIPRIVAREAFPDPFFSGIEGIPSIDRQSQLQERSAL